MKKPKMILFDYGETLFHEKPFEALAGNRALLAHSNSNPRNITAEEIQVLADAMNRDIGRGGHLSTIQPVIEIPNRSFNRFLYEYLGISFDLTPLEMEQVFFDAASGGVKEEGIDTLLSWLWKQNIRTGVISNISFSEATLRRRIESFVPEHHFEFIMASSEYVFRKPSHWLFELALRKADLRAEDVWYCGDNFNCDVEGAAAVGITPVWYRRLPVEQQTQTYDGISITNWQELRVLLESLN